MPRGFAGEEVREAIEREQQAVRDYMTASRAISPQEALAVTMQNLGMSSPEPSPAPSSRDVAAQVLANTQAAAAARQRQQSQQQAALVGTPAMGFTDQMMAGGVSPGLLQARYGVGAPAVSQYLAKNIPGGLAQAGLGLLGLKTAQEHLRTGTGQPVMDPTGRVRGTLSTGPLFGGVVYSGVPIPGYEGEYAELIAPQVEERDEVVPTVTDPVTMQQKCPDGYIFDEDLQACRLETTAPVAAPLEPRAPTRTYSLLDQAPTGLLEFQRRYGLPQQQMGFSLLT